MADDIQLHKGPVVWFDYTTTEDNGPIRCSFSGDRDGGRIIDLRAQPFNHGGLGLKSTEQVTIDVDRWLLTPYYVNHIHNQREVPSFFGGGWDDAHEYLLGLNDAMATLSHFGFDADYKPEFIRRLMVASGDIVLYGYRTRGNRRTRRCLFHGEVFTHREFVEKFSEFLAKYK